MYNIIHMAPIPTSLWKTNPHTQTASITPYHPKGKALTLEISPRMQI